MGQKHSLPGFGADANLLTISGFSGGAFFADQMKVIHSDSIKGAGILAGGPYYNSFYYDSYTATKDLGTADEMAQQSIDAAVSMDSKGMIDPVASLTDQPVFI